MPTSEQVTARIVALLGEKPRTFYEILRELGDAEYRFSRPGARSARRRSSGATPTATISCNAEPRPARQKYFWPGRTVGVHSHSPKGPSPLCLR